MNNIIRILGSVSGNSLVLLDELGSGTDPSEGGALAVALLDYLREKGCSIIATTHYQEVKMYAIETDGVENASCEFDVNTLRPTYRLITGAPGKSNALAIVKRLGMNDEVIERAKSLVSSENKRFEQVIEALEASRLEVEELKQAAALQERKANQLTEELNAEKTRFEHFREKEMSSARQRALSIVEAVRHSADGILDELEDLKRDKDKADFSERVRGMRSKVNSALNKLHDEANPIEQSPINNEQSKLNRPLKLYDTVMLVDINKKGSVISTPDSKGNCIVQVGIMKTKTNTANLRLIEEERVTVTASQSKVNVSRSNHPGASRHPLQSKGHPHMEGNLRGRNSMECDIRGMTSDEGVAAADAFLDTSLMSNIGTVTIIHGKGTGVLRQAVHAYLRGHKRVKSYRLGKFGEGEDGVTIVELK